MFLRPLSILSSVVLLLALGGCSTSSAASKSDVPAKKGAASTKKPEPASPAKTPAASTKRPLENAAFRVSNNALVGSWKGKDARSVIGTLIFCADGRAKAEIAGKPLGGKGGASMTWAANEVDTGEAKIVLTLSAKDNEKPFVMMVKRTSETDLVASSTPTNLRVDAAPEKDKIHLVRTDTSPNCD